MLNQHVLAQLLSLCYNRATVNLAICVKVLGVSGGKVKAVCQGCQEGQSGLRIVGVHVCHSCV